MTINDQIAVDNKKHSFAWVPLFLILYNFCANLSNDIYLPSMPELKEVFSTSASLLQLTMTAWFAGVALPQLFLGPLTDQIGRRPVILWGGICFILATMLSMMATNIWIFIIARFFQGVGVCSLNVTTFGILIDLYTYRSRTQIMNKINMFGTAAPLIGPVIGGYILVWCGWRFNFLVIVLMGLASVSGLWVKLPESNVYLNPHALNFKNIVKNYILLLKNKNFLRHLFPYCLILGGLTVYLTAAPFIIIEKLQMPAQYFGFTQLPIFGAYFLGSLYLARLTDDYQIKKMIRKGILLVLMGAIGMLLPSYFFSNNLWMFLFPMVMYALGFSFCSSPLISEVMSASTSTKGSAAAFLGFGMAMSCMLSSLFLGMLYDGTILSVAFLLFGITAIASAVYFLLTFDVFVPDNQLIE